MFIDAHAHIRLNNVIYCSSELLPQNLTKYLTEANLFNIASDSSKVYDLALSLAKNYSSTSEMGLDKRFINSIPLSTQLLFLGYFFDYASNKALPITLHCVRETASLIDFLRTRIMNDVSLKNRVLWHGFTGSYETARILEKLGVIISIGTLKIELFSEYRKANKYAVIETDYDGSNLDDYYALLEQNYSIASAKIGVLPQVLSSEFEEILKLFKINLDK